MAPPPNHGPSNPERLPLPLSHKVTLVTTQHTDPHATTALRTLLRHAGVRETVTASGSGEGGEGGDGPPPGGGHLVVYTGGTAADRTLRQLGAPPRADLPEGGYRLAAGRVAGRATVALEGVGADGLFHGVQTLRQLVGEGSAVPGVWVRDWPVTAVRGLTEGFYGTPWTRRQRLAQLDFLGRTKQNAYVYAPGDDPYRQARWREPYPAAQREEFRALARRAARNHVTLTWAVAPGQGMCLSSREDLRALTRKVDAMWALGFRAFQLQFQDVSYSEWHCERDADVFGSGPEAAAEAQARVANAVARHLAERHPGARPLSLMPTEFYQDGATAYREALSGRLDRRVRVAWTGVGVVPRTITGRELAGARRAFGSRPLVTMDNYPVNDFAPDRLFLGPYTGREPAVAQGSAALLGTAMEQPVASRVPLFTAADFAWNPRGYRPHASWLAAIDDLAGGDAKARGALRALAGNDASSVLGADESAYLRPPLSAFWAARTTGDRRRVEAAAGRLRAAFAVMRDAPEHLAGSDLDREVRPWTAQLARYGQAGVTAVDLLTAAARGDGAAAWRAARALRTLRTALRSSPVRVGKGVLDPFLARAEKAYAAWAGTGRREAADGGRAAWRGARPLAAVTALTDPGTRGAVEARVPGGGWRRLAALDASGATEVRPPEEVRADAVRVTVSGGGGARHLVPWFDDRPAAALALARAETDAEIGGGPERITARLLSRRPGDVRGTLTAKAPKGLAVRVPGRLVLPRGTRVDVPVEVSVARGTRAGTYEVPVTFAGETRTLVVRAFPRTGGPDLARGARASSSGDETGDFPASAAIDGDATTRWSSPAEDDAWWGLELPRPVRLGRLVLRWQDAYAAAYRIETSADGRTWRTAAVVRAGRGGRESVRMDAPDTRFVRVRGERRATRFGYSLWSVEAYAVRD
ncbi:beta-N-acetylglucosaminidase domain-containing protein [Streptomyces sp. G45]|uniref:beta-N-acetylglucosaminidase domain-containing protein n=1 Tax=Streptomyces sp. G45 TaxID=3406627 RepID=UPI003C1F8589